jgi:PAS domain S-box-containing protein
LVLIATVFLGRQVAFGLTLVLIAIEAGLVYLQAHGQIPFWPWIPSPLSTWLNYTVIILLSFRLISIGVFAARDSLERAQHELIERRKTEEMYRRAIRAADGVPYWFDYLKNTYLFVGEGIERLTGYSAAEMNRELFQSLIQETKLRGEQAGLSIGEAMLRMRHGEFSEWQSDCRIITRAGDDRWISDAFIQIYNDLGQPISAFGLLLDITDRKRIEMALQASEQRFRAIFENSAVGIALGDLDGRIAVSNPAFQRLLGYTGDEFSQLYFSQITHPEDLPLELECVDKLFSSALPYFQLEKRYIRKNGEFLWGRMTASLIRDENGAPLFAMAIVEDITQQRQTEKALHQRDAILEAVAFAAEIFLSTADWRQDITCVLEQLGTKTNSTHVYIFQNHRDANGSQVASMIYEWTAPGNPPDIDNPIYQNTPSQGPGLERWYAAMSNGEVFSGNINTLSAEELEAVAPTHLLAVIDVPLIVKGEWWGFVGFDDLWTAREWSVTERDALKIAAGIISASIDRQEADLAIRRLNAELEQRVQQRTADLEAANRELESFAYSVSHDLRAPLRAIDGYSGLLVDDYAGQLDDEAQRMFENIRTATHNMAQLIDDLLNLSRYTRAVMNLTMVDMSQMAEHILMYLHHQEPERQVEIDIQSFLVVRGDFNLLQAALDNLLRNAWKFTSKTPQARIEVGQNVDQDRAVYYIRDNGAGFDMQLIDKLFTPFQRLHTPGEFEGTGIGLATVKRIIQRHHGTIWAEGQREKGATFYFTLGV